MALATKLLILVAVVPVLGCAGKPVPPIMLDDEGASIYYNGIFYTAPWETMDVRGIENVPTATVVPTPDATQTAFEKQHHQTPTPYPERNYLNESDPVRELTLGEWHDGEIADGEYDPYTFRGERGKDYEIYVFTRHRVEVDVDTDGFRSWWGFKLHPSVNECHWYRDRVDWYEGNCRLRKADEPAVQFKMQQSDVARIVVSGWNHEGRYSLRVLELSDRRR